MVFCLEDVISEIEVYTGYLRSSFHETALRIPRLWFHISELVKKFLCSVNFLRFLYFLF